MNNISLKDLVLGTIKTSIFLIILEIFSSAILPAIGILSLKLEFIVLIVLYLAFKLQSPGVAFIILILQLVHSAFSIEGWAIGTFTGVVIYLSVGYVKDLLSFTTAFSTIVVVQVFQIIWFVMTSTLIAIKMGDLSNFFSIFFQYLPQSLLLSLLSPFFFKILDRFWTLKNKMGGVQI